MPENTPSLPDFTRWPSFPFEGDMRVKNLAAPVEVEPSRSGEDAADCVACNTPDDAYIWVSERWRVRGMDRPTGLPMVLILECRSHLDIGDLPNLLAAELGVMTVRLERAIRSLDGVARVHVNRWGDGSAHLHMWFLARPYGRLQLRGTFLSLWDDILPVIPEEQWLENLALVAAWLGEFGGRAIAEPPHIHWLSPSTFSNEPAAEADTTASDDAWRASDLADAGSDAAKNGTGSDTPTADGSSRGGVTDVDAETRDLSSYAARVAELAAAAAARANATGDQAAGGSEHAAAGDLDASASKTGRPESDTAELASGGGADAPTAGPAPEADQPEPDTSALPSVDEAGASTARPASEAGRREPDTGELVAEEHNEHPIAACGADEIAEPDNTDGEPVPEDAGSEAGERAAAAVPENR